MKPAPSEFGCKLRLARTRLPGADIRNRTGRGRRTRTRSRIGVKPSHGDSRQSACSASHCHVSVRSVVRRTPAVVSTTGKSSRSAHSAFSPDTVSYSRPRLDPCRPAGRLCPVAQWRPGCPGRASAAVSAGRGRRSGRRTAPLLGRVGAGREWTRQMVCKGVVLRATERQRSRRRLAGGGSGIANATLLSQTFGSGAQAPMSHGNPGRNLRDEVLGVTGDAGEAP